MRVRSLALAAILVVTVFAGLKGTISAAWAAEPVPGGTCTTSNLIVTTGGPETTGVRRVMRCNGSTWQQEQTIDAAGKTGIGTDSPAAPLHVGGEAIIGPTTGLACSSTTQGGLRWSSANSTFEMCDGASWKLLVATGGSGTPSTPNAGTGYFVMSAATTTGALTSYSGANTFCLNDLQTNNWLNKSDAASRGLLNSAHVKAFLCGYTGGCQQPLTSTTYTFAASGSATVGGATFTTDASGYGPGNTQNWSGTSYFGTAYDYWTGFDTTSSSLWAGGVSSGACNNPNDWTYNSIGGNGYYGSSNNSDAKRWKNTMANCNTTKNVICMVHPGNETSAGNPGYLVLSSSSWNGNLGGLSGANAKCLTELTTNTNWMGYTAANAAGQLISAKVFALLCTSSTCTNLNASTTYNFAIVGNTSVGGASFTTTADSTGPGDSANWSAPSYFGGNYNYWMNRSSPSGTLWDNVGLHCCGVGNCNDWADSGTSYFGQIGNSVQTNNLRWDSSGPLCNTSQRLLCFVNP